jgi:hypothetical protein
VPKRIAKTIGVFLAVLIGGGAALAAWLGGLYEIVHHALQLPEVWAWIVGSSGVAAYVAAPLAAWAYFDSATRPTQVKGPEVPKEAVEAVAKLLYESHRSPEDPSSPPNDEVAEFWRAEAAAALAAAMPVIHKAEKERLTGLAERLQSWAQNRRREAFDLVGPEKEQARWVATGYDNAADFLLAQHREIVWQNTRGAS